MQRFIEWTRDWTEADRPDAFAERELYLSRLSNLRCAMIAEWVRNMRADRWTTAKELANPLIRELEAVALVDMLSDPADLLDFGNVRGDGLYAAKRRFEALCILDLAFGVDQLEQADPASVVERDAKDMMLILQRDLFSPNEIRMRTVWSYHDPDDAFRVQESCVGFDRRLDAGSPYERENPEPCRVTRDGVLVRVSQRPKGRFETLLKLHRQVVYPRGASEEPWADPWTVADRCGLKLVTETVEQARELLFSIREILERHGAEVHLDGDTLEPSAGPADPLNRESTSRYRVAKLMVRFRGRWHEFQCQTFAGYVSSQYALDGENHELYRLGQALRHRLPLLFPARLYLKESWDDPDLAAMLRERFVQKLGWRVERLFVGDNGSRMRPSFSLAP